MYTKVLNKPGDICMCSLQQPTERSRIVICGMRFSESPMTGLPGNYLGMLYGMRDFLPHMGYALKKGTI